MLLQDFAQSPTTAAELPVLTAKPKFAARVRRFAGGFVGMTSALAIIVGAELFAPTDAMRPSTLLGGMTGHSEAVVLATKLRATQATLAAQNAEQARMQEAVAGYQQRLSLVAGYYTTAYQRLQTLSQAAAQAEQQYEANRDTIAMQSQQGNIAMANIGSVMSALGAAFGNNNLADAGQRAAQGFSQQAMAGLDDAHRTGMERASGDLQAWQQGLPDAKQLATLLNQPPGQPTVAPAAAPPAPPAIYGQ